MTNPAIPAQAIEAALDALGERYGDDAYCKERQYVTTTLEAAAPLLLPQKSTPLTQALRDRAETVRRERGSAHPLADAIETLPARMKARREELGLSMLSVAQSIDVPMMTYRRFELGESDRLRLPHVAQMLRWLEMMPDAG